LGPFDYPPFDLSSINALGVVDKPNGGHRIILDLSQPDDSVNSHIFKDDFPLSVSSVDDAIKIISDTGTGCFMAKIDLKQAYRQIPVRKVDWHFLCYSIMGYYFLDTVLPFGLRSSAAIFCCLAKAIAWICVHVYEIKGLINYYDDYLIVRATEDLCARDLRCFLHVCNILNVPVEFTKVDGPATTMHFLGIELQSVLMLARLPPNKLHDLSVLLPAWLGKKSCTKRELQSIIGKLAWCARIMPSGRVFLRHLIDKLSHVSRPLHHIAVTQHMKLDFRWWIAILRQWNGVSMFIDPRWSSPPQHSLHTAVADQFCSGGWANHMFIIRWPQWLLNSHVSPPWFHLYPIVIAAMVWASHLHKKRVVFHCFSQPLADIWSKGTCKCKPTMNLIRMLFFISASNNFHINIIFSPQHNTRALVAANGGPIVLLREWPDSQLQRHVPNLFHTVLPVT
jgi:hypothetical protein